LKVTMQYGSCFPIFLLFGRFFCELQVNYGEGLIMSATYSLEYHGNKGANFAALGFHRNSWESGRIEKERKREFVSGVVDGCWTCSAGAE
jgi:hypothetical protein